MCRKYNRQGTVSVTFPRHATGESKAIDYTSLRKDQKHPMPESVDIPSYGPSYKPVRSAWLHFHERDRGLVLQYILVWHWQSMVRFAGTIRCILSLEVNNAALQRTLKRSYTLKRYNWIGEVLRYLLIARTEMAYDRGREFPPEVLIDSLGIMRFYERQYPAGPVSLKWGYLRLLEYSWNWAWEVFGNIILWEKWHTRTGIYEQLSFRGTLNAIIRYRYFKFCERI